MRCQNQIPAEVVETAPLEVFKSPAQSALQRGGYTSCVEGWGTGSGELQDISGGLRTLKGRAGGLGQGGGGQAPGRQGARGSGHRHSSNNAEF